MAATARKDSWHPVSKRFAGLSVRVATIASAKVLAARWRRLSIPARQTVRVIVAERTTEGIKPTSRAYARVAIATIA